MQRFASLLLVLLLTSPGCKREGETFGPPNRLLRDNVYVFAGGAEPESIDPGLAYDSPGLEIARNIFEGLMRYDPRTLEPLPGVAESYEISDDAKRWVFRLRPDARWSNGRRVVAEDFVYAWRRVLDPTTAAQYSNLLWDLEGAREYVQGKGSVEDVGVRALDELTLEVRLERPVPWFLELLAFSPFHPVPAEAIAAHGSEWTRPENIISNGPFVLSRWTINYEIELRKNPFYWDADAVRLDGAIAVISDDNHAVMRLYAAGELDWTGADSQPPQEFLSFLTEKRDFHANAELASYFFWINLKKNTPEQRASPLHDVRVRKALNLAIDKEAIARYVMRAGQRPARTLVPDLFAEQGYVPPDAPGYDPEAAKELMRQAGYGPGGKSFPPIEFIYNTHEAHRQVAEAVQQMWKAIGVPVTLSNQEWKVFMSNRIEGYYQIARAGWTADFVDPYTFLNQFLSDSEQNESGWKNAEYDELVRQAILETDREKRYALYARAEAILLDELPILPIYFYSKPTLIGSWVKGWYPNSRDIHPLRDIYLERR